jgi:hypothetical protein
MRRELEMHGEETLHSDQMTFGELAEKYRQVKLTPAVYQQGVKVSGVRSLAYVQAILRVLTDHFSHKLLRSIKAGDLEAFKKKRLNAKTKRGTFRSIASINRELSILRTGLNFAVQNEGLLGNPFTLCRGSQDR